MKKLLSVLTVLFVLTNTQAQDAERLFKKFKGEISLGYGYFPGSNINSGLIYSLEPKYALSDHLSIGGMYEAAVQYKKISSVGNYYNTGDQQNLVKLYLSLSFTTDYYFGLDYSARPFMGAGLGVHVLDASYDYASSNGDGDPRSSTKVTFGGLIRGGVEIKHFRITLECNLVGNTKTNYRAYNSTISNNQDYTDISKNTYFALKLGGCFGGGPKNREKKHRG